MRKLLSFLLAATALAACDEAPSAGRPPPPPPAQGVSASLSLHDGAGGTGPFRLADLTRLAVDARYVGVEAGTHALRIDVISPRGTLYAQYQGALELDRSGQIAWSRVLEVSGTPIDAYHQIGTWRFTLTVDDGAPLAVAEASLVE
jgi:hypothetical protein